MTVFFALLFSAAAVVIFFDYFRLLSDWFGRIKIGCRESDYEWRRKIKEVSFKWMKNGTPAVPENEDEKFVLYKKLKSAGKRNTIAFWQDAAVLKTAAFDNEGAGARSMLERYIEPFSGQWINPPVRIDAAMLSFELLSCRYIDKNDIKPAMDYMAKLLLDMYNRYGFIPYNVAAPEMAFVDTVGMVCPFLIKYAAEYDKPAFIDIAIKQIETYKKYGFDSITGYAYHCFNVTTGVRSGIPDWGRGSAWWFLGITDSFLTLLNMKECEKQKIVLLKLCLETIEKFSGCTDERGFVRRMLNTDSLPDSTATAMFAYCFSKLYGKFEDEKLRSETKLMLSALKSATRRNGIIDYSQGDTPGIGYYAHGYGVMPAAQGFACTAAFLIEE